MNPRPFGCAVNTCRSDATIRLAIPSGRPESDFSFNRRRHNSCVDYETQLLYSPSVTSHEFKRWLQKQDCTFEPGHGGHLIVRRGALMSVLPIHGKGKELGAGLVNRIKKDLGLK